MPLPQDRGLLGREESVKSVELLSKDVLFYFILFHFILFWIITEVKLSIMIQLSFGNQLSFVICKENFFIISLIDVTRNNTEKYRGSKQRKRHSMY